MKKEITTTKIALFKGREIRKIIYNNEWWFSVVDVAQALTDQSDDYKDRKYWNKLAQRLREEGSEVVTNCHRLKLLAPDGKMRQTDCADTEGIFRIIQSIPSPKAEPFKRWLAKFSQDKTLFDFQKQGLQNALKWLWLFYKEKQGKKESLFDHYQANGYEENFDYDLN